jgi:hypothetical protein
MTVGISMSRIFFSATLLLALSLLGGAPGVARAAESYGNCAGFITSLPATINAAGTWCFNQNLSTAVTGGNVVTINADNVTLDCNDFKLDGLAAGAGTLTTGIFASVHRFITIRHCNIRGFYYGISISGPGNFGHLIEDNRFDGNTFAGLLVEGDNTVIRRNRVFDTGGSTQNAYAYGIFATYSTDVEDNTVSGVAATAGGNGIATGIYAEGNASGSIRGNRVRGLAGDGTGQAWGIFNSSSDRVVLRDNDVAATTGTGYGLYCANSNGRARDNTIKGFGTAISGCGNDGGNVVKP